MGYFKIEFDLESMKSVKEYVDFDVEHRGLSLLEAQKSFLEKRHHEGDRTLTLDDVVGFYEKARLGKVENVIKDDMGEAGNLFRSAARWIENFFERLFKSDDLKGKNMIFITCMDEIYTDDVTVQGKRETEGHLDGLYRAYVNIDYNNFKLLTAYEKKKEILRLLMTGMRKIAKNQNWDIKPFDGVYETIVESDYVNELKFDKPKEMAKHKTRKLKAGLGRIYDIEVSRYFIFVNDGQNNELFRKDILFLDETEYTMYSTIFQLRKPEVFWKNEKDIAIFNFPRSLYLDYVQEAEEKLKNKELLDEFQVLENEAVLEDYELREKQQKLPSEWVATVPLNIYMTAKLLPPKSKESTKKDAEKKLTKFSDELHRRIFNEIYDSRHDNYDDIYLGVVKSFEEILSQANEKQKIIGYIDITWLRSSIKNKTDLVLVTAYDSTFYFDKEPIHIYYDGNWLLKYLHKFEEELVKESRKYIGKIKKPFIEKKKWESFDKDYTGFIFPMFRNALDDILQLNAYKNLKKASYFCISFGEYYDKAAPLWIENNEEINELKQDIEKRDFSKTIYKHFKNIDLSKGNYMGTDFFATRFENVNFENAHLDHCILLDAKFWNCNLKNADLSYSELWYSDFSNSDLSGANLSFANFNEEYEINPSQIDEKIFNRIKFCNANLTNAKMQLCDLSGADFRGANLDNCDFTDTIFLKTLMDKKQMSNENLLLSDEQKEQITWI